MKKAIPTLVIITILFGISAFFVGEVYKTGQDRPPLKYAAIPTGTLDFLNRLSRGGNGIIVNTGNGGSWSNDDDLGNQTEEEWAKEEDDYFIAYYHRDKEAIWQGRALDVIREAHKNIGILEELMGKYYYPADVNNRKLSIYLPVTGSEYTNVISKILGQHFSVQGTIGLTICTISLAGCKTEGIVLNPCLFESKDRRNGYVLTLLHEMNHYVYNTSIDYSKEIEYYNWQKEGLADFCCERNKGSDPRYFPTNDQINFIKGRCRLSQDFPEETNAPYWAGEQFFYYMEETYGRDSLKKFIQETYTQKINDVFHAHSIEEKTEHEKWVQSLLQKRANIDSLYADIQIQ